MTNHPTHTGRSRRSRGAFRRVTALLLLVPALIVTSLTGTAFADPPASWENNDQVSPLHVLFVFVIAPVGLFALITLLACLPAMMGKDKGGYRSGQPWRSEPEWFGGPRGGVEAADRTERPLAVGGASDHEDERGGASGRW